MTRAAKQGWTAVSAACDSDTMVPLNVPNLGAKIEAEQVRISTRLIASQSYQ
jgi:hypothetical protein